MTQSDVQSDLYSRIKLLRKKSTDSFIYNESDLNIKIYEDYNLFVLSPHINKNGQISIYDITSFNKIISFDNIMFYDDDAIQMINNNSWENIEITKYELDSKHIILFYHINNWFIFHSNNITEQLSSQNTVLFNNNNLQIDLSQINQNHIYHLLLIDSMFRKIDYSKDITSCIKLLWTCDKSCNVINNETSYFEKEKIYHYSCFDELMASLDIINDKMILEKTLDFSGYCLKISQNQSKIICCIRSKLFQYILSTVPQYKNQYINYVYLYQNNKLSEVLPFLHKYPSDVIRRINISIKILSKEILNIYHLTRKKQNSSLYDSLTKLYKKILYDLHKIYVGKKYFDDDIDDILIEKKSISIDIVYTHLKNLHTDDLLQLFNDRMIIIDKLKEIDYKCDNILYTSNIDIITQTELMNK